jgi:hypothetical protein
MYLEQTTRSTERVPTPVIWAHGRRVIEQVDRRRIIKKAAADETRAGKSGNNHQARLQAWPRSRMGRQHEGGYAA